MRKRKGKYRKRRKKRGIKEKEKERKGRKRGPASTSLKCSNSERFDRSGSELVCAPKGRGPLILWLFFV